MWNEHFAIGEATLPLHYELVEISSDTVMLCCNVYIKQPDQDYKLDAEDPNAWGFDALVKAKVNLKHKDKDMMATVFGQKRDANGNLIGHKHKVPTLHS
jgi:hypothetical protein